mmetsp:Transcript_25676/g.41383  ORF Transcript_25676/g.41383 Transcript_25676/m.41383 type:complete len:87 (-) Transcript_25676:1059-1319(-)
MRTCRGVGLALLLVAHLASLCFIIPFIQLQLCLRGCYSLPSSVFLRKHSSGFADSIYKRKLTAWFLFFVLPVFSFVLTRPVIMFSV